MSDVQTFPPIQVIPILKFDLSLKFENPRPALPDITRRFADAVAGYETKHDLHLRVIEGAHRCSGCGGRITVHLVSGANPCNVGNSEELKTLHDNLMQPYDASMAVLTEDFRDYEIKAEPILALYSQPVMHAIILTPKGMESVTVRTDRGPEGGAANDLDIIAIAKNIGFTDVRHM